MKKGIQHEAEWILFERCTVAALIQLRLCAGESQQKLADALGWFRAALSLIESGKQRLKYLDLLVWSSQYNVPAARVIEAAAAIRQDETVSQILWSSPPRAVAIQARAGFSYIPKVKE